MNRLSCIVAGGIVSTALFAFAAGAVPAAPQTPVALASATKPGDETHEIHRVMAEAADHALGKNGVTRLLEIVAKSDRDRIEKEMTKGDDNAYQALADKVNKAWKDKYKHAFSAENPHIDKDLAPLKVTTSGEGHGETATVAFPAESGASAYELHLTREHNGFWRIQLPDTVDGKTFYANAMKALENVDANSAKWPDTADEAYPIVVSQLLQEMAFPATAK